MVEPVSSAPVFARLAIKFKSLFFKKLNLKLFLVFYSFQSNPTDTPDIL